MPALRPGPTCRLARPVGRQLYRLQPPQPLHPERQLPINNRTVICHVYIPPVTSISQQLMAVHHYVEPHRVECFRT